MVTDGRLGDFSNLRTVKHSFLHKIKWGFMARMSAADPFGVPVVGWYLVITVFFHLAASAEFQNTFPAHTI